MASTPMETFSIGGAARTEAGISQVLEEVKRRNPKYAVLIAPFGVDMNCDRWDLYKVADSTRYGDIMSSLWQVGILGSTHHNGLESPGFARYAKTLGERYTECGLLPAGDERGVIENRAVQFSSGIEVIICNQTSGRELSVNSCVGVLSLQNVIGPKASWPLVECRDGNRREISTMEQCVVLGNKSWRNSVHVSRARRWIRCGGLHP